MDSKYPTLDLLERHGLRSAYVILMLGTCSWTHFQALHDAGVPEDCRLPRNLLMALKGEYRRLVEVPRSTVVSTADLLDEFNRARGARTLDQFYWDRFLGSLNIPKEEAPDEDEMYGARWQLGPPSRMICSAGGQYFAGNWRGQAVTVIAVLASPHGDMTDPEYDPIETAREFVDLYVQIVVPGDLTRAQMEEIVTSPCHPAMRRAVRVGTKEFRTTRFYHELQIDGLAREIDRQEGSGGSKDCYLTDAGVAQLTEIVADLGVTDFRAE